MQPHQMNCRRGDLISRFDKPHDDFTKHLNFHNIRVCVFAQFMRAGVVYTLHV